jgi:3-oxoacyl-[acyl-carrier-protein] synthase II
MFSGQSGVVDIRGRLVPWNFPVSAAAPVSESIRGPDILQDCNSGSRFSRLAGIATEQAVRQLPSGLPVNAVVCAVQGAAHHEAGPDRPPEDGGHSCLTPLDVICGIVEERGHGPVDPRDRVSINNVTVSSNQAIGLAFQRVRSGLWDRVVVCGVYAGCGPRDLMNFHMLGTLTIHDGPASTASRPFSGNRSGFVLGEGAAVLVLETRASAERRGAAILGAITGYASTSDAYRVTDGRPDVLAASGAMRRAMRDAGLCGEQISAISAHGTSTRMNDRLETLAIKKALGPVAYQVPVISLKSQIGHCLAAAGALEAIASLLMLSEQTLAPTINYTEFDPECDLDYVPNQSRRARLSRIMSNNFGFGGQNACVIFEQATGES